jgi:hypothetical protein
MPWQEWVQLGTILRRNGHSPDRAVGRAGRVPLKNDVSAILGYPLFDVAAELTAFPRHVRFGAARSASECSPFRFFLKVIDDAQASHAALFPNSMLRPEE